VNAKQGERFWNSVNFDMSDPRTRHPAIETRDFNRRQDMVLGQYRTAPFAMSHIRVDATFESRKRLGSEISTGVF
jgi:hypothetical protein